MIDDAALDLLLDAQHRYQGNIGHYDETLDQVTRTIAATGSAGKADIGALLFWKRLRADTPWVANLQHLPDQHVRAVTAKAVIAVNDPTVAIDEAGRRGREALLDLPGFKSGPALPSALLVAAAPNRMAVYDRRAEAGLRLLGLTSDGKYSSYMRVIATLLSRLSSAGHEWKPRDVDTALFTLGRADGTAP